MSKRNISAETTPQEITELRVLLELERRKFRLVQEITKALSSSLDLDHLLTLIMEKVRELMSADRATLFLVSEDGKGLWSKIFKGGELEEIRLSIGEGIAGWVAVSGEKLNIRDAYNDERFQPAVDIRSGYRTESVICVPMRDTTGEIIGVMQLLNKQADVHTTLGGFTDDDIDLLEALSGQAAVSIENAKLYQSMVAKNVALLDAQDKLHSRTNELNVLYEIEREMAEAFDLDSMLHKLLHRAMTVVSSGSGSIALLESDGSVAKLRFRATAGHAAKKLLHQAIESGHGAVGWAIANRKSLIANTPETDAQHVAYFAEHLGASPRNLLCAPLVDGEEVLGAIELRDREYGEQYSEEDLRMLTLIAGQASRTIAAQRSKQEFADQDRLAGIGQMVAGVLHDLRTPMTIISGYAQLMAQIDDAAERESYVEQILQQFDLLSGMTREVLAFARGETTVLIRKVFVKQYMEQVSEQLQIAFTGHSIKLLIDSNYHGAAFFDQQSMLRLIHNLARNAVDAMRGRPGIFRMLTEVEGDHLCFAFSDNGPGIPRELEGRLFELFASASEGGSGLGLAICKKIVEDHHGTISYSSATGEGTTFTVRLPLHPLQGDN